MANDSRIAALMAPGETVIWQGRAGLLRSLTGGQLFWAVLGLGLMSYGVYVLWGYYGLLGTIADSIFRDVLSAPGKVFVQAGIAVALGGLALIGFILSLLQARGTRFFLTQRQALVHMKTPFGENAVSGRIQVQGQVATGRSLLGAFVVIPTGAGPDQDGFIAFAGLSGTQVAEVLGHIRRMAEGQLDGC